MIKRRLILETLTRQRLLEVAETAEVTGLTGKRKGDIVAALARRRQPTTADLLAQLYRDELKAICEQAGLDTSGRAKQVIIDRLLGRGQDAPPPFTGRDGAQQTSSRPGPASRLDTPAMNDTPSEAASADGTPDAPTSDKPRGRRKKQSANARANGNGANLGFEQKLWQAADKMRGHMDASEYKHVALGLIFLKYISDAFEETHRLIAAGEDDLAKQYGPGDPEDRTEYEARNVFWIPPEARWAHLQNNAKQANVGRLIDDAMVAIERDNPNLKGVLPKNYNSRDLDRHRLGELIDLISTITLTEAGNDASRSRDILGRVYEYFLGKFAEREGKSGGEFYTPQSVVKLLVEMIEPYKGRVFDPCCGSGGMFVQSEKFVKEHGGRLGDIAVYGQESNPTTWKLARLNLAIRGIDANLGPQHADSFHRDLHPDLKADYILANPPFNMSDWGGERLREDKRWQFGTPPAGNANYAWIQHFIHHLAPTGTAGFVMANGSMSSGQSGEGEIRQHIVEADMVDCMIALPGQLFYTTGIPVCLWFLTRDKQNHRFRDRRGQTLFIDARKMGALIDRTHRELSDEEIARIARTYHAWRGEKDAGGLEAYEDVPGYCKSATLDEIKAHGYVLTPGRYVGAAEVEDDGEPFEEKMPKLVAQLEEQFAESARLEQRIRENLARLGYDAGLEAAP